MLQVPGGAAESIASLSIVPPPLLPPPSELIQSASGSRRYFPFLAPPEGRVPRVSSSFFGEMCFSFTHRTHSGNIVPLFFHQEPLDAAGCFPGRVAALSVSEMC